MAALPGLMQVEPLQASAPLLGALGARPAPVVLPEDTGGPAGVTDHHATIMPPIPAPSHAPTMRPGPSSAHGMDATRHMNPCQLWEALWLTSSAPIKLPKPSKSKCAPRAQKWLWTANTLNDWRGASGLAQWFLVCLASCGRSLASINRHMAEQCILACIGKNVRMRKRTSPCMT